MIKVYVKNDCTFCEEVKEKFRDLVLAHKVINVDENKNASGPDRKDLPVIEDEGKMVKGEKKIKQYFEDITKFLHDWNKFQSDVCYIDDDGNVICTGG